MAKGMKDWTEEGDTPVVPQLSHEGISALGSRLDRAIQLAQHQMNELQTKIRDLQGQVQRMHDTKAKLATIEWAARDTEEIEKLPPTT